jgi:hypothetical protein
VRQVFEKGIDGMFFTEGFADQQRGISQDAIPEHFVGPARLSWLAGWNYGATHGKQEHPKVLNGRCPEH